MPVDKQIQEVLRIPREPAPADALLGLQLQSVGPGIATFTLEVGPAHHNPLGLVHGGVLMALADSAMVYAMVSTLGEDETFTTVESKINFLRPVFSGKLRCVARVDQRGRTIAYAVADVYNEEGKVVAKAVGTNLVIRREGDPDALHHRPRPA